MHDIQWLFLGWFMKFLAISLIFMSVLHLMARAWRKSRQRNQKKLTSSTVSGGGGLFVPRH